MRSRVPRFRGSGHKYLIWTWLTSAPRARARRTPCWIGPNVEPQLTVDDDGTIYATNPAARQVIALDPTGRLVRRWIADEAGRKFDNPTGIGLDRKRRILYVVNSGNSSISKIPLEDRRKTP